MGNIEVYAKWNLKDNNWSTPKFEDYGRSFAIANYENIINNDGKYDYVIIAQGSRVEDHSKDFVRIKEKEVRIDNILRHYGKKNGNYVVQLFLMDADAPIIEDCKIICRLYRKNC